MYKESKFIQANQSPSDEIRESCTNAQTIVKRHAQTVVKRHAQTIAKRHAQTVVKKHAQTVV